MDKKKIIYIGSLLILTVIVSITYFSYAFFTHRDEQSGKLNIITGTLDYKIKSSELNSNNSITLSSGESKIFDINITSLNTIKTKYELYYTTTNNNIRIGYAYYTPSTPKSEINAKENLNVTVMMKNLSNSNVTITFGVHGGLSTNSYDSINSYGNALTELTSLETYNIYVVKNLGSTWYNDNNNYSEIFRGHNVTVNTSNNSSTIYNEIINGNYDIIVYYFPYWAINFFTSEQIDYLSNNYNLITVGDDNRNEWMPFIVTYGSNPDYQTSKSFKQTDNSFTKEFSFDNVSLNGNYQVSITFDSNTILLYGQNTASTNNYDMIGAYSNAGKTWVHSEYGFYSVNTSNQLTNFLRASVNYITELNRQWPTKPTFTTKTSNQSNVTLAYTEPDDNITSVSCYYGDSENTVTSLGTVSNNICTYPSTAFYAKVCVTNSYNNEACSDTKKLAEYFIKNGVPLVEFVDDIKPTGVALTVTQENGYYQIVKSNNNTNRVGIITSSTYDFSNYNSKYLDISYDMEAFSNCDPSFSVAVTDASWVNGNNTRRSDLNVYYFNASTAVAGYTSSLNRTLKYGQRNFNNYTNDYLEIASNASSQHYTIKIYNLWFQLKD